MSTRRSGEELVLAALESRKLPIPDVPSSKSAVHLSTQRALAALEAWPGKPSLEADFRGRKLWLYRPMTSSPSGTRNPYLFLGHADGGNYTVFIRDYGKANPAVYICDSTDEWDEKDNSPRSGTKLALLAEFIKKLRAEVKPKIVRPAAITAPGPVLEQLGVVEGVGRTLALHDSALLFLRGAEIVRVDVEGGHLVECMLGEKPCPNEHGATFLIDADNVVVGWPEADKSITLAFRRRIDGGWTEWQRQHMPRARPDGQAGFSEGMSLCAVSGDRLVLSDHARQRVGFVQVFRYGERWQLDATFEIPPTDGDGEILAALRGDRLVYVGAVGAPAVREHRDGAWHAIPVTMTAGQVVSRALDVTDEHIVLGAPMSSTYLDEHGWPSGRSERPNSGMVVVLERAAGGYVLRQHLKNQDGVIAGIAEERLGSKVTLAGSCLIATGNNDKAKTVSVTLFVKAADGRWCEVHRKGFTRIPNLSLLCSGSLVVAPTTASSVDVLRVQPPPARAVEPPALESVRIGLEGDVVARARRMMGLDLVLLAPNRYATLQGSKLIVFDGSSILEERALETLIYPRLLGCGAHLLLRHAGKLHIVEGEILRVLDLPLAEIAGVFGGPWGALVVDNTGVAVRLDTRLNASAPVSIGHVTTADGNDELLVVATSSEVRVLDLQLANRASLTPKKKQSGFGSGVCFDDAAILVGSSSGVHVFEPRGDGYEESSLLGPKRGESAGLLVRSASFLLVSNPNALSGVGAIMVYERDPKKRWKPKLELVGAPQQTRVLADDDRVVVGRHNTQLPVQIYPLDTLSTARG